VILAALLALSACSSPQATGGFRVADAPIYSAAAFDAARLQGRWVQVATFAANGAPRCQPGVLDFAAAAGGLGVSGQLCLDGRVQPVSGLVGRGGPGRLAISGMEDWWILWVDTGYRTLAVGTPSGGFGFILDRGLLPQDRLNAAREIFDFNGYTVGALGAL
jgi:apolipoprotein D and lipocalin family protein